MTIFDNKPKDELKKEKRGFWRLSPFWDFVFDLVKIAAIAFIIVWPIHKFIFQPFYVVGPSMEPNFYDKEYLIIEEVSYRFNQPQRGEVVVFRSPVNPKDHLIKRVIGLPGERILIKQEAVYIYNRDFPEGLKLDESAYLSAGVKTPGQVDIQLGPDQYYLLGDNRNVSLDSRVFGSVKKALITGRTWVRGWPVARAGVIKAPDY